MHESNSATATTSATLARLSRLAAWVLATAAAITALTGCSSVNPGPFRKYAASVREAQIGMDAAMTTGYDWTRAGFVESFSSDTNSRFGDLLLDLGEGYAWTWNKAPVHLSVKQARSALGELNATFVAYADLLVKLADNELVGVDTFDQLARDLNRNAGAALKALQIETPGEDRALFSTVAAQFARRYLEHKRRAYLRDAISQNQTNIEWYAAQCVSLIKTMRGTTKAYYTLRAGAYNKTWENTTAGRRAEVTDKMLKLNEQYADTLHVFEELERAYRGLPRAHADLKKGLDDARFDLNGIQELYSSGKRMQRLYEELRKANAGAND